MSTPRATPKKKVAGVRLRQMQLLRKMSCWQEGMSWSGHGPTERRRNEERTEVATRRRMGRRRNTDRWTSENEKEAREQMVRMGTPTVPDTNTATSAHAGAAGGTYVRLRMPNRRQVDRRSEEQKRKDERQILPTGEFEDFLEQTRLEQFRPWVDRSGFCGDQATSKSRQDVDKFAARMRWTGMRE